MNQEPGHACYRPVSEAELAERIATTDCPFEIVAGGTKARFGHAIGEQLRDFARLDLSGFDQIHNYEPHELVVSCGAAMRVTDLAARLRLENQWLAFEPPDWRWLLNGGDKTRASASASDSENDNPATIGGIVATNLAGSTRVKVGAVRDHLLGFRGVNGMGQILNGGGRVVKNVTGYDLPKLICGSFGTLLAMTEVTLKALPLPEAEETLLIYALDDYSAAAQMAQALNSPFEIIAAAHLPSAAAARSQIAVQKPSEPQSITLLRLCGTAASIAPRLAGLVEHLGVPVQRYEQVNGESSRQLWAELANGWLLPDASETIWRVSTAPQQGAEFITSLKAAMAHFGIAIDYYYDWAGGLIFVSLLESNSPSHHQGKEILANLAGANILRHCLAEFGGHATLLRGSDHARSHGGVFQPLAPPLMALARRIKASFDPKGWLNPGRMTGNSEYLHSGVARLPRFPQFDTHPNIAV